MAVSNIGYKFTRSGLCTVIEGLGYNSGLYDTGACLMGIRMSFSYHRFSFLNFIFYFQSAVLFVWKMCYICLCDNFREQIEFFVIVEYLLS